jgi:hypothetical protein
MKDFKILPVRLQQVYRQNFFVGKGIYVVHIGSTSLLHNDILTVNSPHICYVSL